MSDQARDSIDRRRLLLGGLTLAGGLAGRSAFGRAADRVSQADGPPRALLLLEISGGNDGLNTIVPYADERYHAARPQLGIGADQVLRIDEQRGWNAALPGLRSLFDQGLVNVVEGVGYPHPNRSHFSSVDIWHTARAEGRAAGEGWIAHLLRGLHPDDTLTPRVVHVGTTKPLSLESTTHPVAALGLPATYRWAAGGRAIGETMREGMGGEPQCSVADHLREVMRSADSSSDSIRRGLAASRLRAEFPEHALGQDLALASRLLRAELGLRVVSVTQTGYDTHGHQRGTHEALLRELDSALTALFLDLEDTPLRDRVTVLVFSEFGRRVAENASLGTDHGTAGPVFVIGHGVRGGFSGAPSSLEVLDQGDLIHTTDFRSVYAGICSDWFGVPSEPVVGGRYPELRLFA